MKACALCRLSALFFPMYEDLGFSPNEAEDPLGGDRVVLQPSRYESHPLGLSLLGKKGHVGQRDAKSYPQRAMTTAPVNIKIVPLNLLARCVSSNINHPYMTLNRTLNRLTEII